MPADLILSNDGIQCASGAIVDVKAAMPVSGTYTAGSIVLELTTTARISGWKRLTTGSGHVLNTDWVYFSTYASTPSRVRVTGSSANGSTNTAINRFTTIEVNTGSDITYADSATLGGSFTINTTGLYAIKGSLTKGATGGYVGISKNSTQLTTNIESLSNVSEVIDRAYQDGTYANHVGAVVPLTAGDVIRSHGTTQALTASPASIFEIVRIS